MVSFILWVIIQSSANHMIRVHELMEAVFLVFVTLHHHVWSSKLMYIYQVFEFSDSRLKSNRCSSSTWKPWSAFPIPLSNSVFINFVSHKDDISSFEFHFPGHPYYSTQSFKVLLMKDKCSMYRPSNLYILQSARNLRLGCGIQQQVQVLSTNSTLDQYKDCTLIRNLLNWITDMCN